MSNRKRRTFKRSSTSDAYLDVMAARAQDRKEAQDLDISMQAVSVAMAVAPYARAALMSR